MHDPEATQVLEPWPSSRTDSENHGTPRSVLEKIRALRDERRREHVLDVDVPGRDGYVGLRLGPITSDRLAVITDRAEKAEKAKTKDRQFNLALDTIGAAALCVLVRTDLTMPYDELRDESGDRVGLDERLCELLDLQGSRQRELLLSLFGEANAPALALIGVVAAYGDWATQVTSEVDESLVGE